MKEDVDVSKADETKKESALNKRDRQLLVLK